MFAIEPFSYDLSVAVALLNEALGDRSYTLERLTREVSDPRARFLMAREGDALVGVAGARVLREDDLPFYDRFGEGARILHGRKVGSLYVSAVAPSHRGRGIGSALARARIAWLESEGCDALVGISWVSGRTHTSRPVFERHGFRHVATSGDLFTHLSTTNDFDCPSCGHPCRCDAMLFVRV